MRAPTFFVSLSFCRPTPAFTPAPLNVGLHRQHAGATTPSRQPLPRRPEWASRAFLVPLSQRLITTWHKQTITILPDTSPPSFTQPQSMVEPHRVAPTALDPVCFFTEFVSPNLTEPFIRTYSILASTFDT
ncbi:hypothetical protein BST61_g8380 [Cercospora zeina]